MPEKVMIFDDGSRIIYADRETIQYEDQLMNCIQTLSFLIILKYG